MNTLLALSESWRQRATELRTWADAEGAARSLEACAAELEAAVTAARDQELTLAEASTESGYSERRLRELVSEGAIPNAGRKGRPRIRRGDLPRKPGGRPAESPGYDVGADALDLVSRMEAR